MKVGLLSRGRTRGLDIKTLPVLLINYLWSPRAKVVPSRAQHSVFTDFPKDRNCDICMGTKIARASCRRRTGDSRATERKNDGDLITADHKILSEWKWIAETMHRYAVVVQDLATQWIQAYPCKTKTSQETQRSLQKFLEPDRKPKAIYTDNSLEFGKVLWRTNLESLYVNTTQITNEWDLLREQCAELRKGNLRHCCILVWIKNGGRILWNAAAYLRNIQDLSSDEKTPLWKAVRSMPFTVPSNTVWCNGRIPPYFCERHVETTSIWS